MRSSVCILACPARLGRRTKAILVTLLAGAATSCQAATEEMASAPGIDIDSAGIRIVTHDGAATGPALSLDQEPVYRAVDYEFQGISDGVLLPSGEAVIADGSSILWLDATGSVERVVARRGVGPGEVMNPRVVVWLGGDSVLVEDVQRKFVILTRSGFAREIQALSIGLSMGLASWAGPLGKFADTVLLLGRRVSYPPNPDAEWAHSPLVALDLRTGVLDSVASFPFRRRPEESDSREQVLNPFYNGFGLGTATEGAFVVARGDIPELRWIDATTGLVEQIVRWPEPPREVTDSLWASFESAFWEIEPSMQHVTNRTVAESTSLLAMLRSAAGPPIPVVHRGNHGMHSLVGDADGNLWVGRFTPHPTFVSRFEVFGRSGDWLGYVLWPPRTRLLHIGEGKVLAVEHDAFGVETPVVYSFTDRQGAPNGPL